MATISIPLAIPLTITSSGCTSASSRMRRLVCFSHKRCRHGNQKARQGFPARPSILPVKHTGRTLFSSTAKDMPLTLDSIAESLDFPREPFRVKVLAFDADAILFATLSWLKSRTSSPGVLEAVLKCFFQHSASPELNENQIQARARANHCNSGVSGIGQNSSFCILLIDPFLSNFVQPRVVPPFSLCHAYRAVSCLLPVRFPI